MAWDLPGLISAATDRTAAYFIKYKSCFDVLALHTHSGADGDGAVLDTLRPAWNDYFFSPTPTGDFDSYGYYTESIIIGACLLNSSAALDDEGTWTVYLPGGTYTIELLYHKLTTSGIASVYWNGSLLESFDTYAASASPNHTESIIEVSVLNGANTIRILMASKNSSSGGYTYLFSGLRLIRTGN